MSKFTFASEKTLKSTDGGSIKYQPKIDNALADRELKFCFSLISLEGNCLCYNSEKLSNENYHNFFEFLKYTCSLTFKDLMEKKDELHFHAIDLAKKYELKLILQKLLNLEPMTNQFPTIYQCAVKTDSSTISPRIVFYIEAGNIKLLFLDSDHSIYSANSSSCFNEYY